MPPLQLEALVMVWTVKKIYNSQWELGFFSLYLNQLHHPIQQIALLFEPDHWPDITRRGLHSCFNITEKGQMIEPDWYNRIFGYTKRYDLKKNVLQWK